jgi:hypothetical protein
VNRQLFDGTKVGQWHEIPIDKKRKVDFIEKMDQPPFCYSAA